VSLGKQSRKKAAKYQEMPPVVGKTCAHRSAKIFLWIPLIAILLFVIVVRVRLLDFPLERDEGEYAYFGQLILQGVPPYSLAYNMKFPGTYLMYAVIMALFGQTARGIHLGFLCVNVITIILIYLLSKRFLSRAAAIAAAAMYAFLSLQASVLGFAAHATHFVVCAAVGAFLILLKAFDRQKGSLYLISGIVFGIGFIMKQSGILFCLFGAAALVSHHCSLRPVGFKSSAGRDHASGVDVRSFILHRRP